MTGIDNILSSEGANQPLSNKEEIDKKYRYWRLRIFYSMFIGYSLYYVTRKSFTFVMPVLAQDLHFEKGDLGLLGSIFAITYGISKFVSGIIGDRTNPRYFMAFGLFMTGVLNIFFGLSSTIFLFALFWGFNGLFQGFGWPPCARYLTHWYSHTERGSWWSSWNISHNVGAFSIPWIAGFLVYYFDWRWGMYIPGVICILGALFLVNRLRDTPQSLGLPSIEAYRNDYPEEVKKDEVEKKLTFKEIFSTYLLRNRFLWLLAISYFFVYIVRQGINDWTALYLVETKGYSPIGANGSVSLFEIGGIFGTLTAGWSSDYFFRARRGPVIVLYSIGVLAAILGYWSITSPLPFYDSAAIFIMGFTLFGPQMMIGMQAAELCPKNAAATATGFVGTFAYLGAAVSGYPLGMVTQHWGWDGYFLFMAVCAACSIFLLIPLLSVDKGSKTVPAPSN